MDTSIFPTVRPKPTSMLWWTPSINGCTQPLSSDPKIKLESHNILPYIIIMFLRNLHKLESLMPYTKWSQSKLEQGGSKNTHTRPQRSNTHTKQRQERKIKMTELHLRNRAQISLKSLNSVVAKSRSCSVHLRRLGARRGRLEAPFIAPRGLGAVVFFTRCWKTSLSVGSPDSPMHH
jgi:hypothetical protein